MNSILIPYNTQTPVVMNIKRIIFPRELITKLNQKKLSNANKNMCTHLSNKILSSQFFLGKTPPGRQSKIVTSINHASANQKTVFFFFKCNFVAGKNKTGLSILKALVRLDRSNQL
jgi:hypothetical protein